MAIKKVRYFELNVSSSGFVAKLKKEKEDYNFSDIKELRNILTKEKAKILYTLKIKSPKSIYELAKILKRDVRAVRKDVKVLEKFGFIYFLKRKIGNKESYEPKLAVNQIDLIVSI